MGNLILTFIRDEIDEFCNMVNSGDMFKPIKLIFQSREGEYWSSLSTLEDYLLSVLSQNLLAKMVEEHYIMWIAVVKGNKIVRLDLKPTDEPKATFNYEENSTIYAYCNLHGLWKKEI